MFIAVIAIPLHFVCVEGEIKIVGVGFTIADVVVVEKQVPAIAVTVKIVV